MLIPKEVMAGTGYPPLSIPKEIADPPASGVNPELFFQVNRFCPLR